MASDGAKNIQRVRTCYYLSEYRYCVTCKKLIQLATNGPATWLSCGHKFEEEKSNGNK